MLTQIINYRLLELWRAERALCARKIILYNSCGVGLHVLIVHLHAHIYVLVCLCNWSLFNQTKVEKGAPREHFSFQMKSDENRAIITREFFQSPIFIQNTDSVCMCFIHLSTKL